MKWNTRKAEPYSQKQPQGSKGGEKMKVYILKVLIKRNEYFLVDMNLSLSKNYQDAMLFMKQGTAEIMAGICESKLEADLNINVSVYTVSCEIDRILSGAISTTMVEHFHSV